MKGKRRYFIKQTKYSILQALPLLISLLLQRYYSRVLVNSKVFFLKAKFLDQKDCTVYRSLLTINLPYLETESLSAISLLN